MRNCRARALSCWPMLQTFLIALLGGVVALSGNAIMHLIQSRTKVREEGRSFVRSLHAETVDVVADIDLFVRSIRAAAVAGSDTEAERAAVKAKVDEKWEGDLLRRVWRLRFGHPDPDVRVAAEQVEDAAWPYIAAAGHAYEEPANSLFRFRVSEREKAVETMNRAMVEFRRSVHAAPTRDLPKGETYTGENRPGYLERALEEERRRRGSDDTA